MKQPAAELFRGAILAETCGGHATREEHSYTKAPANPGPDLSKPRLDRANT